MLRGFKDLNNFAPYYIRAMLQCSVLGREGESLVPPVDQRLSEAMVT